MWFLIRWFGVAAFFYLIFLIVRDAIRWMVRKLNSFFDDEGA